MNNQDQGSGLIEAASDDVKAGVTNMATEVRRILKERSRGEVETWGFVAAFMEMIDEAEKRLLSSHVTKSADAAGPLQTAENLSITAETLARRFHETYERLAPNFGYKTREASAKPWSEVPSQNKELMIAVCKELLDLVPSASVENAQRAQQS